MLRPDFSAKNGGKYIYLSGTANGSKMFISTGSSIPDKSWNQIEQSVRAGIADQRTINNKLAQIRIQINNLITRADSLGNALTTSDIKNIIKDGGNTDSFYLFMEKEIARLNRSSGTIKNYELRLSDLKKFRMDLKFSDITAGLWYDYEKYLADKGNNQNTIFNAYTQVSVFFNKAVELDLLTINPWAKIKVKNPKGNRQFLTDNELKQVETFFNQTERRKYKSLLRAFLFSCYTGLRLDDAKTITGQNITGQNTPELWINKKMQKSGKIEQIPLNNRASALLPKKIGNGNLFLFAGKDKIGSCLTEIMSELKINKKITFHCSRHTFATISLELSGDIALVSKLLGHKDIRTTQIYAKVLDSAKSRLMDKWDQRDKVQ